MLNYFSFTGTGQSFENVNVTNCAEVFATKKFDFPLSNRELFQIFT